MSKVKIEGNASGTGTLTIAAPNTNTDRTLTLPDGSGELLTTTGDGSGLTGLSSNNTGSAFSVYLSGNQAVSNGTLTKISFNVEEYDVNGDFSGGRFTPTVAGYYQINASMIPNYTSLSRVWLEVFKNGSVYRRIGDFDGSCIQVHGGSLVYLNGSTDYIEIYAYINGTGTLEFNGGLPNYTWANGSLVRAA